jgi:hypothetical protein
MEAKFLRSICEDTCSLFKLAGISQYGVKGNLLYLSFSGNVCIWFMSLDEEYRCDWKKSEDSFLSQVLYSRRGL